MTLSYFRSSAIPLILSVYLSFACSAEQAPVASVCARLRSELPPASPSELEQLARTQPGLALDRERAYTIDAGPLRGSSVVLAAFLSGSGNYDKPQLLLYRAGKLIQRIALPNMEPGWNLLETLAVGVCDVDADGDEDILVLALLEPLSGRPEDYWRSGFVFLSEQDGTLLPHAEVNDALNRLGGDIESLETIRALLRSGTTRGR